MKKRRKRSRPPKKKKKNLGTIAITLCVGFIGVANGYVLVALFWGLSYLVNLVLAKLEVNLVLSSSSTAQLSIIIDSETNTDSFSDVLHISRSSYVPWRSFPLVTSFRSELLVSTCGSSACL